MEIAMKLYNVEHKCLHSKSHFILSPITFDDLHAVLTLFLSGVGVFFSFLFSRFIKFSFIRTASEKAVFEVV